MATLQSLYVRTESNAAVPAEQLAKHLKGRADVRMQAPWVELEVRPLQDMHALGRTVATATLADVVAVQVQTAASVFGLSVFSGGKCTRRLAYAEEAWLQVDGERQPWEAEAFFSSRQLEDALESADFEQESAVRERFRTKNIEVGACYPAPEFLAFLPALGTDEVWWSMMRAQPISMCVEGRKGWGGLLRSLLRRGR